MSYQVPSVPQHTNAQSARGPKAPEGFAPIYGFFPTVVPSAPAENETWLELDRKGSMTVYKGSKTVKTFQAEGEVSLEAGSYYLINKQKNPVWYAPDVYFTKRQLAVPPEDSKLRYRRGALGPFALYPTTTFPIHSGPFWTEEVGGLRVSRADLASIYYLLSIGAPIVVK